MPDGAPFKELIGASSSAPARVSAILKVPVARSVKWPAVENESDGNGLPGGIVERGNQSLPDRSAMCVLIGGHNSD